MSDDKGSYPPDKRMDEMYVHVGRVVASWSALEFMICRGIWELANVEQFIGACITAQIVPPAGKVRAYISLVQLLGGKRELIDKLNKFSQRLDGLARQRNRVAHDPWAYNITQGHAARAEITADRKLVFELKRITYSEMDDLREQIADTITRFQVLHAKVLEELPPMPRPRFEHSAGFGAVQQPHGEETPENE